VSADIAHTGAQAAHHLIDGLGHRSAERHAPLDTLGNKLLVVLLEVTVAAAAGHRARRSAPQGSAPAGRGAGRRRRGDDAVQHRTGSRRGFPGDVCDAERTFCSYYPLCPDHQKAAVKQVVESGGSEGSVTDERRLCQHAAEGQPAGQDRKGTQ